MGRSSMLTHYNVVADWAAGYFSYLGQETGYFE
jgi:hypothetical protein